MSVTSVDGSAEVIFAKTGQIVAFRSATATVATTALTALQGHNATSSAARIIEDGAVEVVTCYPGLATLTQRFSPDPAHPAAIQWSLAVLGESLEPQTAPLVSSWSFDEGYAKAHPGSPSTP